MSIRRFFRCQRGAALAFVALTMVIVCSMAAMAIDVGRLVAERARLQSTADASALAGAALLPDEADVATEVQTYTSLNHSSAVVLPDEIVLGHWDRVAGTFEPAGSPIDAVSVIVRRTASTGNAVGTYFARVFGVYEVDVTAAAIATGVSGSGSGQGSRFLVDDEMIDSDIPAIEELAAKYGMGNEEIISDNDGDWFIDLPAGEILELPTGQIGDEALFEIVEETFPFWPDTDPSFEDFLNYNEDSGSWRYDLIPKEMLDPLYGVYRQRDPDVYPTYVDPSYCQVSPIYKSDISDLSDEEDEPAVSTANALGWRRGLLAFKVIGIGEDPDGNGDVLPNIIIEICSPNDVDLGTIAPGPGTSSGMKLRLVH